MLHDMKEQASPRERFTEDEVVNDGVPGSVVIITDKDAASALMDPSALRHLAPFIGTQKSVSQAAEESGERPNTTLKRVRRFMELGLLEVAREVPRAGRPIKLYRSVAQVYFVPFEATGAESLEAGMAERDGYYERLLRRNVVRARIDTIGNWGTRIYKDGRGRLQVQTAVTPDANVTSLDRSAPAVLSAWRDGVMLEFEDAKALQAELFSTLQRYLRKSGPQRYIVHVAMAPLLESIV
jgi:hypothetical protein